MLIKKLKIPILLFLISINLSCNSSKKLTTNDDLYKVLNIFLEDYSEKIYLNKTIICCGFESTDQHPRNSIYQFLKKKKYYTKDSIDIFKKIIEHNKNSLHKKIVLDLSKINNDFVNHHSFGFYKNINKSIQNIKKKRKDNINRVLEFPDLSVSVYFTKNKNYALVSYTLLDINNSIKERIVLFEKNDTKWNLLKIINRTYP